MYTNDGVAIAFGAVATEMSHLPEV